MVEIGCAFLFPQLLKDDLLEGYIYIYTPRALISESPAHMSKRVN